MSLFRNNVQNPGTSVLSTWARMIRNRRGPYLVGESYAMIDQDGEGYTKRSSEAPSEASRLLSTSLRSALLRLKSAKKVQFAATLSAPRKRCDYVTVANIA